MKNDKDLKEELFTIDNMQKMCEESLSPKAFESWIELKESLYKTRNLIHIHQAGTMVGLHIDTCGKCRLDLRNEIHQQISQPKENKEEKRCLQCEVEIKDGLYLYCEDHQKYA